MNSTKKEDPVIIVGGGWAGLAAAVELVRHEIPVTLLESAKQLGGRARSVNANNMYVDNGQHLMLGAYEATLDILRRIGLDEKDILKRQALSLQWFRPGEKSITLTTAKLPAPFHLAWGLFTTKGLSFRDRLSALNFSRILQRDNFSIEEDCSVEVFLQKHRQSKTLITALWEPLCLGALNTHIHEASAKLFLRTLSDSFSHTRRDSDLLLTQSNLGEIFPEPASDYIETRKGSVRLGQRVIRLNIQDNCINGVVLSSGPQAAQQVILATPHTITKRLIKSHPTLKATAEQIEHIQHRPICTVYLQYDKKVRLGRWLRGSLNTVSQWVFDRSLYGQPGLMAIVISGTGEHLEWDNDTLCGIVAKELAAQHPKWPAPLSQHVIREKRATFASTVNIQHYRPPAKTPVKGLYLAGDYTDVGLPATLEGAVRSGLQSAQLLMRERRQAREKR
ncbi:MAG: FAD-dependent oxidoreductase [Ectothiorhodospiraceae bacterium]|nr:FAD-dependent oxidoreductase [Ectothiorhodospiraceae bacterium]